MRLPIRLPLSCDRCGQPADTIHILPVIGAAERVECACPNPDHDPGGYWVDVDRWDNQVARGRFANVRQHILDSKAGGRRAVALVERRMAAEARALAAVLEASANGRDNARMFYSMSGPDHYDRGFRPSPPNVGNSNDISKHGY